MLARAVVRDLYSGAKVSRVLSLMALIMGAAPMLAPLIGGQILLVGTWRTIFWVTTSFGSIMLVMVLLILPETLPPERRSASASLGAMVKSYAILLRNPLFLSYALGGGFVFGGVFSFLAGSPFVYITLYHVPPQLYGVLFGVNILGLMALSALNAKIVTRYGTERILSFGIGMAATAGIVLAAVTFLHIGGLAALLVPLFFFVASLGLTNANSMAGCLNMFPERAGAASAVVGALQMITGSALGAMVGAFGNGTAEPMAGFVCLAGITAFICQRGLGHYSRVKHRREGHAVPRTP
jgi:DHA1 family bicyclomycin/chloramphenicol resistance-like MFS transporter